MNLYILKTKLFLNTFKEINVCQPALTEPARDTTPFSVCQELVNL